MACSATLPYAVKVDGFRRACENATAQFRSVHGIAAHEMVIGRIGQADESKWSPLIVDALECLCDRGVPAKSFTGSQAGIITGILLAIARISGETAPLLFTALNNQFFSLNMGAPMPSLPVVIFQFALSPYAEWQKLAWTGALLITVTVLGLSILARSLTSARKS